MLGEWIGALVEWVAANPHWAGFFVFLISLSESLAIVGMVVPGVVMMFAAGALIGAGAVAFWPMYWLAVAGAVMGDGLSFWLGRQLRGRVADIWPFSRHPETLERGVRFFHRYGGKSVVFGRFFGPVRAVIPLVAGMLSMPSGRFLVANLVSALAWALAYLAPGIVLGASLELAAEVAFHLVVLALALVILTWFVGWAGHRVFLRIQPLSSRLVQWLLHRESRSGWGGEMAAALADPNHPEARGLATFAGILVLATVASGLLVTAVAGVSPFAAVDQWLLDGLASLHTPVANHFMVLVTMLGDAWFLAWVSVAIFVVLLRVDRRSAVYWAAAVAFAFVVPLVVKVALQIPRPHTPSGLSPWGFPSAHVMRVVVIFGFLAVVGSSQLTIRRRWPIYVAVAMVAALVGVSRVYLGVHWPSDVVGGMVLGVLWVAALGIAYRHHPHGYPKGGRIAGALVTVLMVAVLFHLAYRQDSEVARYEMPRDSIIGTQGEWTSGKLDLGVTNGGRNAPPNIQYAGSLDAFRDAFADEGWVMAEPLTWGNALKLLAPSVPLADLPVLPRVYGARNESLLMIKELGDAGRLVLRLWKTDVVIGADHRLWMANIGRLEKRVMLNFVTYPKERPLNPPPVGLLPANLERIGVIVAGSAVLLKDPGLRPNGVSADGESISDRESAPP